MPVEPKINDAEVESYTLYSFCTYYIWPTFHKSDFMKKPLLFIFLTVFSLSLLAQKPCVEVLPDAKVRLKSDIGFLASGELEGRAPGSRGIKMASQYILEQYKKLELQPYDSEELQQEFEIDVEVGFTSNNGLIADGIEYRIRDDFYPVQYSSNGVAEGQLVYVKYGITAPEKKYDDYKKLKPKKLKNKIFVMDISAPDGIHPHSAYLKYHDLGDRIELAKKKGAIGVVLVNLKSTANDISPDFRNIHSKGIPAVFITNNEVAARIKKGKEITFVTEIEPKSVKAYNLVGFMDNHARKTIVIGAHYDHLGMGGKNSLSANKEPEVHNGADDNASGVAGMLEIARNIVKGSKEFRRYNYLFIAFSGEEMGLLGSAYFTSHTEGLDQKLRYMINLDMIGRMEDDMLAISGVGTCQLWEPILESIECRGIKTKTSLSGVGPSDHTNFYYLNVPVLHFFTGTHVDYHKPTDDVEKINFEGEQRVIGYVLSLIMNSMPYEEMEFTATSEPSQSAPKFSVTLGVMPDYMYDGEGMHIDGVTEGRAADRAGLVTGDVVIRLGEVKVVDMNSYMKALGQYKKGDEADIEYLRNGEKLKGKVKF